MNKSPDPVHELLAVPPPEFVSARNKLAAEVKKSDAKRAAAIKALPKPSTSVWATNQVARRAPERITGFLEASDALQRAQTGPGGSEESRRGYQAALAAQREALDRAVTAARDALTQANLPANRDVLERVTNDLRWAALGNETRQELEEGRLTRDLEPPDFSSLVGRIPVVARPSTRPPAAREQKTADSPPRPNPQEPAASPVRPEQKRRLDALRARHAGAKEQADHAREDLQEATTELERAEKALLTARRELAVAEKRVAEAARVRAAAEATLVARTSQLDQIAAELGQADGKK